MVNDPEEYLALLYGYAQYKEAEKQAEIDYLKRPFKVDASKASSVLKQYMIDEGVDELSEQEHGITGVLSYRGLGPFISNEDWKRVPDASIVEAARAGFLRLDVKLFRDWHKKNDGFWADQLERYIQDGGQTPVFTLKRED